MGAPASPRAGSSAELSRELAAVAALLRRHGSEFVTSFDGSSMEPAIPSGADVLLRCGSSSAIHDVVAFVQGDRVLVHRVVARSEKGGWILTQGDACALPDPPLTDPSLVIGRVALVRRGDAFVEPPPPPDSLGRRTVLRLALFLLRLGPGAAGALLVALVWLRRRWLALPVRLRRLRARGGRLVLALASTALALLAAVGAVRVFAPQVLRVPWDDEVRGVRAPRPGVGGRHLVPGAFDVTVRISSQRFRGSREFAPLPPPGTTRIAVLGDSVAFGWGAKDDEAYPAQLGSILRERLARAGVEVINAGFPATCLGEKVLWYEEWVRRFRPDVVILTVVADDVDGDLYWRLFSLEGEGRAAPRPPEARRASGSARRSVLRAIPGYSFLAQRSHLFALVRRGISLLVSPESRANLASHPGNPEYEQTLRRRFATEGLPLLKAEVRWLKARVDDARARLLVVFAPGRDTVEGPEDPLSSALRWRSEAIAQALVEACAEGGIFFADLTPALRARWVRAGRSLYYPTAADAHPTPEGYRALAEAVAEALMREGLLGKPLELNASPASRPSARPSR